LLSGVVEVPVRLPENNEVVIRPITLAVITVSNHASVLSERRFTPPMVTGEGLRRC
jgi:hypothetical protein